MSVLSAMSQQSPNCSLNFHSWLLLPSLPLGTVIGDEYGHSYLVVWLFSSSIRSHPANVRIRPESWYKNTIVIITSSQQTRNMRHTLTINYTSRELSEIPHKESFNINSFPPPKLFSSKMMEIFEKICWT